MAPPPRLYKGARALLATMHGKERVIAPLAARFLGLSVDVAPGLDTDAFGTFSRDVARAGSPLDAARAKIEAAFALAADVEVALASEGSFGPHPHVPFAALGREYMAGLRQAAPGHRFVIDKMPINYMYCGMIRKARRWPRF